MNSSPDIAREVGALLETWRSRTMSIVIAFLALMSLPPLIMILCAKGLILPWMARGVAVAAFLSLLFALWRRDWSLQRRAWFCFAAIYGLTAVQWAANGLLGAGRLGLFLAPLLALVLVSRRAGWIAVGVSVAMFAGFTALAGAGFLQDLLIIRDNSTKLSFWLVQGLLWLAVLITLMVLLTHFQNLQLKILIDERRARRDVEAAAAEQRRLEEEVANVSEEERRRLGADLHDGLCQHLTAALLECTAIENALTARGASEGPAARRLRSLLEGCIGSAYDAAKGLCPVDLDPESLVPALGRLSRQTQQVTGLSCEFRACSEALHLDPSTTLHLFRIAQEAVSNAVKHARCSRIILELRHSAQDCILSIMDDGQLATPGASARRGGMGTCIMSYRAKSIGGTLSIEHPSAGGTLVTCRIPRIPNPASPAFNPLPQ